MVAMTSDATRGIWLEHDEVNVRRNRCKFAAKFDRIWKPFSGLDLAIVIGIVVLVKAAAGGHLHILYKRQTNGTT